MLSRRNILAGFGVLVAERASAGWWPRRTVIFQSPSPDVAENSAAIAQGFAVIAEGFAVIVGNV